MNIKEFLKTAKDYTELVWERRNDYVHYAFSTITLIETKRGTVFVGVTGVTISFGDIEQVKSDMNAALLMLNDGQARIRRMVTIKFNSRKVVKPSDKVVELLLKLHPENAGAEVITETVGRDECEFVKLSTLLPEGVTIDPKAPANRTSTAKPEVQPVIEETKPEPEPVSNNTTFITEEAVPVPEPAPAVEEPAPEPAAPEPAPAAEEFVYPAPDPYEKKAQEEEFVYPAPDPYEKKAQEEEFVYPAPDPYEKKAQEEEFVYPAPDPYEKKAQEEEFVYPAPDPYEKKAQEEEFVYPAPDPYEKKAQEEEFVYPAPDPYEKKAQEEEFVYPAPDPYADKAPAEEPAPAPVEEAAPAAEEPAPAAEEPAAEAPEFDFLSGFDFEDDDTPTSSVTVPLFRKDYSEYDNIRRTGPVEATNQLANGVAIEENNPFFERSTEAKDEVVTMADAVKTPFDEFDEEDEEEDDKQLTKKEMLKMAKKRKKIAKNNSKFKM